MARSPCRPAVMSSAMSRFWAIACRITVNCPIVELCSARSSARVFLPDRQANKDQRYDHTNRSNDLCEVGYLLERHNDLALPANLHGGRVRPQRLSVHCSGSQKT